nr:periphilin-1-like isoform X2 [Pelodiscus sinensis]|eukprot:XP_006130483.1 periphilin-1-like isoform X2 [Pelodiscus sinensis]
MFPGRGHPNGFFHDSPSTFPADFHRGDEGRGRSQDHQQAASWDYHPGRREERFRGRWHSPFSRDTEPYPADFYGGEEGRCWASQDHPPPARRENQPRRHEEGFRGGWHSPFSRDVEPYPADFYGGEEDRCWAPQDHQEPARWENQARRHKEGVRHGRHSARSPNQHCPESDSREERGGSWDRERGDFPSKYRGHGCQGWKHPRGPFRGGYRGKFAPRYHHFRRSSSREKFKSSRSSASRSLESRSAVQPEATQKATDPPSQAGSAMDTEPPASSETTDNPRPVKTEGTELVQLGAADNHGQACCALGTDSVLTGTPEDRRLPDEDIKLVRLEASQETTDHPSQGGSDLTTEPPAPPGTTIRTEETELKSPQLQPEDDLKAPDLLSQAVSALEISPPVWPEVTGELLPVGKEEMELEQLDAYQEAPGCPQACAALSTPLETMEDLRSAAILARKEEIELSYQQYSLAFAVVATMLLQKEPSMEAALGAARRANLRQGGGPCLQELERFIHSYDAGAAHS